MNKTSYDVKYALYPVKESRISKAGKEYSEFVCYIISKAYVMEDVKYLKNDGNYQINYKVCFPHVINEGRVSYYHRTPDLKLNDSSIMVTSRLFDSYEEACESKDKNNLKYNEDIVEKYNLLETEVLELEKDMEVSNNKKSKQIIK